MKRLLPLSLILALGACSSLGLEQSSGILQKAVETAG